MLCELTTINAPSLETCYDLIMDYLHKLNVVIASYGHHQVVIHLLILLDGVWTHCGNGCVFTHCHPNIVVVDSLISLQKYPSSWSCCSYRESNSCTFCKQRAYKEEMEYKNPEYITFKFSIIIKIITKWGYCNYRNH
jgi:hypothetical protein